MPFPLFETKQFEKLMDDEKFFLKQEKRVGPLHLLHGSKAHFLKALLPVIIFWRVLQTFPQKEQVC